MAFIRMSFGTCFRATVNRSASTSGQARPACARSLVLSGSATTEGFNPLNRSQKLRAISKIPIGESYHHQLTTLRKPGKMRRTRVQAAHHADEITPKAASALGMYFDLNQVAA